MTTTQSNLARKDDYRVSPGEQEQLEQSSRHHRAEEDSHHHHYHHHHHHHHGDEHHHHHHHHHHGEEHHRYSYEQSHIRIDLSEEKPSVEMLPAQDDGILHLDIDRILEDAWGEDARHDAPLQVHLIQPSKPAGAVETKKNQVLRKQPLKYRHPALHRLISVLMILVLVFISIAGAGVLWLTVQLERGRGQMIANYDAVVFSLPTDDDRITTTDNGRTITYNGHTYAWNENISTVLFLGIDCNNKEEFEAVDVYGMGGQADVILLIAQDTTSGETKILNISRDTYAEMMTCSESGYQVGYAKGQICMAYGYGDGKEKSCENMVSSVSTLLYGMPISKYLAIDMAGVRAVNDALGGVTLQSMIDMSLEDGTEVSAGEQITLHGEDCNTYLMSREHDLDGNNSRILREKQYVQAFASQAKTQAVSDFGTVSRLYQAVMPYTVTDLEIGNVLFLAKTYLSFGMDFSFMSLDGSMDWLENQWGAKIATLYPDEEQLFETVLDIYYTQVD